MKRDSNFYSVIQGLAFVVMGHAIMVLGLVLGLGLFLTLPALMTVFALYYQVRDRTDFARLEVVSFVWQHLTQFARSYALWSALWTLGILVIPLNMSYLLMHWGNTGFALTLVSILIWGLWIAVGSIFAYLRIQYPDYSDRELFQNALAYGVARYVEIFIGYVLIIGCLLFVEHLSLGLLIFTFFGIISYSFHMLFSLLISGVSLNQLIQQWRRFE